MGSISRWHSVSIWDRARNRAVWLAGAGLACGALAIGVAGCSSSTASLSTGSLFGSNKPKVETPAEQATNRALHVGTTAARAQRCGYVFDPAGVRQGYLAFESAQGGGPEVLAKAEKSYDYTVASVTKSLAGDTAYCNDTTTGIIKRDLNKVLAGDYGAPARKLDVSPFSETVAPLDREKVFNPIR